MRAYSMDLRERIVRAVRAGKSKSETARVFGVGLATVKRYVVRDEQGELAARKSPGRPRSIPVESQADLERQLDASPDATLEEHCEAWQKSHGTKVTITTMHYSIARAKYTLKHKR